MAEQFTVKLREGRTPAFVATTAQLEDLRATIAGFARHYDVTPLATPEKPAPLAKAPAEAVKPDAKPEKSK